MINPAEAGSFDSAVRVASDSGRPAQDDRRKEPRSRKSGETWGTPLHATESDFVAENSADTTRTHRAACLNFNVLVS